MKTKISVMALLWPVFNAFAQTDDQQSARSQQTAEHHYHSLSIGDTVPDVEIKHLINYPAKTVHLTDFKGKLLILDFWATWCSPCVASFPEMQKLRKTFGDRIVILPVTDQDEKTVGALLTNMQKVKGIQGFSVVRDTVLAQLFKHAEIPHYVWINESGIVSAITSGEEVTPVNIQCVLRYSPLNIKMKEDVQIIFDETQPLLAGMNAMNIDSVVGYHILTKHIDGYASSFGAHYTPAKGFNIVGLNLGPYQLFSLAYSKFDPLLLNNRKRVILSVKDTSKLLTYYNGGEGKAEFIAWCKKNTYCYELVVDHKHIDDAWKEMQEDLDKAFPEYEAGIVKIKSKFLVLVRSTKTDLLTTKGGEAEQSDNKYSFHLQNTPWKIFPLRLQTYYLQLSAMPLIDETGITGNVDLDLSTNMSSVADLRDALRKYGIGIIEAERDQDMIAIKDRPVVQGVKLSVNTH